MVLAESPLLAGPGLSPAAGMWRILILILEQTWSAHFSSTYTKIGVDLEKGDLGMDGKEALFWTVNIQKLFIHKRLGRFDCKMPAEGVKRDRSY